MSQGQVEKRRLRPRSRSELRSDPSVDEAPVSREVFSAGFERCFAHVYAYVGGRVNDRQRCERIVSKVLAANLDLLVGRGDQTHLASQLETAADRLIEAESSSSPSSASSAGSSS